LKSFYAGEDVVAGIRTPEDLDVMKNNMLVAYAELLIYMRAISVLVLMHFVYPALQLINLVCLSSVICSVLPTWLVPVILVQLSVQT
jgi:hypothetical protein